MKKKDLVVGEIYAHKDNDRPHMLMSMQLWRDRRTGWGGRIEGYEPAHPKDRMGRGPGFGSPRVGRVVLSAEYTEDLAQLSLPTFLEYEHDVSLNAINGGMFMDWMENLPEEVSVSLENTACLVGPYNKVARERKEARDLKRQRLEEAKQIRAAWEQRQKRVITELNRRGLRSEGWHRTEVFPGEGLYLARPDGLHLTIESLEELLGIKEEQ